MLAALAPVPEPPSWTVTGLLVSAVLALSGVVVYLYRENRQLQTQWRDDIQATKKEMIEINRQTSEAVQTMHELFERTSNARGRH